MTASFFPTLAKAIIAWLLHLARGVAGLVPKAVDQPGEFLRQGQWPLEFEYTDKSWLDFGRKKRPNKWITTRPLACRKRLSDQTSRSAFVDVVHRGRVFQRLQVGEDNRLGQCPAEVSLEISGHLVRIADRPHGRHQHMH